MQFFLLLMVLCLAVALGVIAVVAVGMRGMYYERNPHLAKALTEAAKAFIDFCLTNKKAQKIWAKYGFELSA